MAIIEKTNQLYHIAARNVNNGSDAVIIEIGCRAAGEYHCICLEGVDARQFASAIVEAIDSDAAEKASGEYEKTKAYVNECITKKSAEYVGAWKREQKRNGADSTVTCAVLARQLAEAQVWYLENYPRAERYFSYNECIISLRKKYKLSF